MFKPIPDDLSSLLKWFDVNYIECIDEKLVDEIAAFDINNPTDQDILIEKFLLPEFVSSNDITKQSMMKTLNEVPNFREADVRKVLARTLLFKEPLHDYRAFFDKIRTKCEALQKQASTAQG